MFQAEAAQAKECTKWYLESDLQTKKSHLRKFNNGPNKSFMVLYWELYGIEALLDDGYMPAVVLQECLEKNDCGLQSVSSDKDMIKQLKRLSKSKTKRNSQKKERKYIDELVQSLPDRPPVAALDFAEQEMGQCGFTPEIQAKLRTYRLEKATPEQLARETRCEIASKNLLRASAENRADSFSLTDRMWFFEYNDLKKTGHLCVEPPEYLVANTFTAGDPYASMPLDFDRPEHFRQFSADLDFSASQPLQSECEASFEAGTLMFNISPLAKEKPEEAAWMSHYTAAKESGDMCNPIPKRLAEWGETYVWQNGWPFAYDPDTAKRNQCGEAAEIIIRDSLGGEYARWMQGYNMRRLYPETAKTNYGGVCAGIPKHLKVELMPRINAARKIREQNSAERQRQYERDIANAAPAPPTLSDMFQAWSREMAKQPIVVERCYTNSYGRYHCYDTVYRQP